MRWRRGPLAGRDRLPTSADGTPMLTAVCRLVKPATPPFSETNPPTLRGQTPKHGAPRTQRGAVDVGEALGSDAVREMKELALRSRPAGGGFKPPPAALAEDRRGERGGKGAHDASGGDQEDGAQPSLEGRW